jgi:hypothetical protein
MAFVSWPTEVTTIDRCVPPEAVVDDRITTPSAVVTVSCVSNSRAAVLDGSFISSQGPPRLTGAATAHRAMDARAMLHASRPLVSNRIVLSLSRAAGVPALFKGLEGLLTPGRGSRPPSCLEADSL